VTYAAETFPFGAKFHEGTKGMVVFLTLFPGFFQTKRQCDLNKKTFSGGATHFHTKAVSPEWSSGTHTLKDWGEFFSI
jgi:hypothetical protein